MEQARSNYNADKIEVLEGLSAVRKRPGMYIGSTGTKGLHHLVWEVVDNSIDEFLAGFGNKVIVILHKNDSVEVRDRGRGIPVDIHSASGRPALEIIMTTLHAGGKFNSDSYSFSGGLHGVGVSVVNALSEWLEITTCWQGQEYRQKYRRGRPVDEIEKNGSCSKSGTTIIFKPDSEIFTTTSFRYETLVHRLQESAFLNSGLQLELRDYRDKDEVKKDVFSYEGGIREFVSFLNKHHSSLNEETIYYSKELKKCNFEIALQYNEGYTERIFSYVNNIKTDEGGYHETGFKTALTRAFNNFARENNLLNNSDPSLTGSDLREGLTAVLSLRLDNPQFEGQTKNKLGNSDVKSKIETNFYEFLTEYLSYNPETGKAVVDKALQAVRARQASKKARELSRKNNSISQGNLPVKLADCSSRKPEKSELYLVEGDSAGGSAKQGRDRKFQAILPLKGKILNVERARLEKILSNKEIVSIISSLGTGIGEDFSIDDLRYHKIIIMTDADIDGAHIATLILTLFYRYMDELIKNEHIYLACPPLYRISSKGKNKYLYNDKELADYRRKNPDKNYSIQRYKGLGEMNPDQLWKTTMNPENRRLLKVEIDDLIEADEIFTRLMGSNSSLRKEFIFNNASEAIEIDV